MSLFGPCEDAHAQFLRKTFSSIYLKTVKVSWYLGVAKGAADIDIVPVKASCSFICCTFVQLNLCFVIFLLGLDNMGTK